MRKAIFFDRDGVLIEDVDLLCRVEEIKLFEGVSVSLKRLKEAGFLLFVVSNQTVVARGLITEDKVEEINMELERLITKEGGPKFDGIDYCPHHPNATLPRYRIKCDCRKPEPGMILRFADQNDIDLSGSYMVGDRISDVIAGRRAGCKTILLQTGKHLDKPIETWEAIDTSIEADFICKDIRSATKFILENEKCVR